MPRSTLSSSARGARQHASSPLLAEGALPGPIPCERSQGTALACDFFTVDTVLLLHLDVLFIIEIGTWGIHLSGVASNPAGEESDHSIASV